MNNSSDLKFGFGRNWKDYTRNVGEEQIQDAMESLRSSLGFEDLKGLRVLDAGCGSGLFSLAACRLGACEVVAFDYDPDSVSCATDLNNRYGPYTDWTTTQGDALNCEFLKTLGDFDIVYSWGVLHHTGNMWKALENISTTVNSGGLLFISIYNDQGWISKAWRVVKKTYARSPRIMQRSMAFTWYAVVVTVRVLEGIWYGRSPRLWFKGSERGMDLWHDVVDWIGGYPFETASMTELQAFLAARGFSLVYARSKSGSGCNELVVQRIQEIT